MRNKERIAGIFLFSLSALVLLSLFNFDPSEQIPNRANEVQHGMGIIGFWLSYFLIKITIGYASYVFPLLMMIC